MRTGNFMQPPATRSDGWAKSAPTAVPQKQSRTTRRVFGMADISYVTLAGSYGIFAHSKKGYLCQKPGARDVLVLKRDGSYAVYLAKQRTHHAGVKLQADISGKYSIAADGTLLLTRTDSRSSSRGYVEADGSIVLSTTDASPIKQRWLARKIICGWPKCHACHGNRWHYCVRERVVNSL